MDERTMKNYQRFKKYFIMLSEGFKEHGMRAIDIHQYMKYKKSYYTKIGITDEEKIKQLEIKKTKEMNDRLQLGLELVDDYGSVYEIEDDVMRYIAMNKTPPRDIIKKLKLPFKSIFIETEITRDDFEDIGVNNIGGILIVESAILSDIDKQGTKYEHKGRIFLVYYFCEDINNAWIDQFVIQVDETRTDYKIHYSDTKTYKFIRDFLMNFILFINDPEIELVTHKRSDKNIERRIRQKKLPLPDSRKVRIIGKLKKYVDGIRSELVKGKFNFRFWVSGHYRTLTSDKYTKMRNKVIRIEPYIKGKGMLLKRTYILNFEKSDDRKPDELSYEDI